MFKNDLLAGQRILITGGGTGIGRSIAQRFLSLGAEIVICGRRENVLEAASHITITGFTAIGITLWQFEIQS